jgi:hypothetical protein
MDTLSRVFWCRVHSRACMSPVYSSILLVAGPVYPLDNLQLSLCAKSEVQRQMSLNLVSWCRTRVVHGWRQHDENVPPKARPGCRQLTDLAALTPPHGANARRQEPH